MMTRRTKRLTVAIGCRELLAAILCITMLSSANASTYAPKRKPRSEIEWPAQVVAVTEPPRPTGTWWVRMIAPTKAMTTTTTTMTPTQTTMTTIAPTQTTTSWPAETKRRRTHRRRPKHRRTHRRRPKHGRNRRRKTTREVISKTETTVTVEDGGTDACSTALTTPAQVPRTVAETVSQDVDTRFVDWFVFTYTLQSVATVLVASFFVTFVLYCFLRDRCWRPFWRRTPMAMANMLLP